MDSVPERRGPAPSEHERLVTELSERHPVFARRTIERLVERTFEGFRDARVQQYVPLLVRREVETRLRAVDADFRPPAALSTGAR